MHKVKTQRFGEMFAKNMLIIYFYTVIIKTYKIKKLFNKFPKFPERLELTTIHHTLQNITVQKDTRLVALITTTAQLC